MNAKRIRAAGLAAALIGWSFTAGIEAPWRRHPVLQAALGTALAVAARAEMGFRDARRRSGLRIGGAAALAAVVTVAAATTVPRARTAMAGRDLPQRPARWLGVEIPLGTVWSEETAFRGALTTLAIDAFGSRSGRAVQAVTFGLTHIPDARAAGESIGGTVAATTVAGWVFALLAQRSGSLIAPMLAHLAINEAGAVAALLVRQPARIRR